MSEFATTLVAVAGVVFGPPLMLLALLLVYMGGVMRGEGREDSPGPVAALIVGGFGLSLGGLLTYVGIEAVIVLEAARV